MRGQRPGAGEYPVFGKCHPHRDRQYTGRPGVRSLEREIASIDRKVAREVATKGKDHQVKVNSQAVPKYLGVPKYRFGRTEEATRSG